MKAIRIPLQPHSHFHFGEFKFDSNVALSQTSRFAHSDTLFSALVSVYASAIGNADRFVNDFKEGNLKISSLFYYLKKGEDVVYLLPKPMFLDIFSLRDGHHKLRNKISFVSKGVWEQGFLSSDWLHSPDYQFIQHREILFSSTEYQQLGLKEEDWIFSMVDLPKNPIRKGEDKESIYYQANVEISSLKEIEIGFYFLYEATSESLEKELQRAINLLAFTGIGGEKSNTGRTLLLPEGMGEQFELNISEDPGLKSGFTNISLLNPVDQTELDNIKYAQTILRGGGEYTGIKPLKVVRMIKEGALLTEENISGKLVEIGLDTEDHPVLRNGKAFNLPLKYKNYHE
jgi:CRISPR type III-A-associated RAMP protein Csm4